MCCTWPAAAHRAHAAGEALIVRQQNFNLAIGDTLTITVGLPDDLDSGTLGAGAVVTFASHPLLEHSESFAATMRGSLGDVDDEFPISLDPADADPNVTRPDADSLSLTVPTSTTRLSDGLGDRDDAETDDTEPATDDTKPVDTTSTSTSTTAPTDPSATTTDPTADPTTDAEAEADRSALQFYDAGVHAVEIVLTVKNRTVATAVTFVNIVDPNDDFGTLPVGLVMGQNVEPSVDDRGDVSITTADTDELTRLADTLDAIDAVPAAVGLADTELPRAVFVQPSTLQALASADPVLAARLTQGLISSEIIAAPLLPLEPSAAAAAGQTDQYTKLLRDGEDLLKGLLPRTDSARVHIDRDISIMHQPFTTEAADMQSKLGARMMVMNFPFYDSAAGGIGMLTDTSQLVSISLPGNTSVPAAIIDPFLSKRMDDGADAPVQTAIQMVADLLVIAHSIDDDGGAVSRHGMVLARSDVGVPDAQLTTELVSLLATTQGLNLVEPNDLGSTVDLLQRPGSRDDLAITLPDQSTADLDDRVQLIDQISAQILSYASMLPDGAPQVDDWLHVLDALPSTAVDDQRAKAMVADLGKQFAVYTDGIQGPDPFTFTLTGRRSTLTFSLRNNTDTTLDVRVKLSSPKLTFPDGDVLVHLAPNDESEVNVRAEALSNGKSDVFLRVYAPAENSDVQLIPQVVLTARVSSLAGLGQLLTGACLLLLLTWWGRHWQQTRRKRIAAGNIGRHPSNGTAPLPDDPGPDDLGPDAAASSLSPS